MLLSKRSVKENKGSKRTSHSGDALLYGKTKKAVIFIIEQALNMVSNWRFEKSSRCR